MNAVYELVKGPLWMYGSYLAVKTTANHCNSPTKDVVIFPREQIEMAGTILGLAASFRQLCDQTDCEWAQAVTIVTTVFFASERAAQLKALQVQQARKVDIEQLEKKGKVAGLCSSILAKIVLGSAPSFIAGTCAAFYASYADQN